MATETLVPFGSAGWRYLQVPLADQIDRSGLHFDDSNWATGTTPFHEGGIGISGGTIWNPDTRVWVRKTFPGALSANLHIRVEDGANVYLNGHLVLAILGAGPLASHEDPGVFIDLPAELLSSTENLLAIDAFDEGPVLNDQTFLDVQVTGDTYRPGPALRGRQRGDGLGSSSATRGRQLGSRQASLRGRAFV